MAYRGNVPSMDDDEVDDYTFLASGPKKPVANSNGSRQAQLLEERRKIEERMLQSSKQSLGLVHESEKMGLATAEELLRQGEKLQNVDRNLDSMNATMRTTQKHLTSMKSLFGGIKNYFGAKAPDQPLSTSKSVPGSIGSNPSTYKSALADTLGTISSRPQDNEPRNPGRRAIGAFDDDEDDESSVSKGGNESRSRQIDKQLDSNLSELDMGLGRLKNLALGLGNEIETQNEMIERITTKAERAEDTIGYQNRQMKQILKK